MKIDIKEIYSDGNAKLDDIEEYITKIKTLVKTGEDVVITGAGPIWLYLKIAHALHGLATSLTYNSPVTGDVVIFNHNPF